jgi:hypothetical protein
LVTKILINKVHYNDSVIARQTAGLDHLITARAQHAYDLPQLIFSVCHEEDRTTAGQFAVLLWTVWNNRNDKVWNGKNEAGRSMGFKALHLWHDWFALQHHQPTIQQQQHVTTWQKPPMGWSKCNVDVDFIITSTNLVRDGVCMIIWVGS